jgi:hypothetical protein
LQRPGRGEEPSGEKCPPPDSDPLNDAEFGKSRQAVKAIRHTQSKLQPALLKLFAALLIVVDQLRRRSTDGGECGKDRTALSRIKSREIDADYGDMHKDPL